MNKTLLIAKNDFEGIASAILINVIKNNKIDIDFYKYEQKHFLYNLTDNKYDCVFIFGLKNAQDIKLNAEKIIILNDFEDVLNYCKTNSNDKFESYNQLNIFCKHTKAYLNWTWKKQKLYYGKNIDELSKYFNRINLVKDITDKIINNKELINDIERQLIIFSKKIITNYIEKKNFFIVETDAHKYAYAFCEINEIELANKILENTDVDAVILVNLNNNIIRIKTSKKNDLEKTILNNNGYVNCNGGTLKLDDNIVRKVHDLIFSNTISLLEGGDK